MRPLLVSSVVRLVVYLEKNRPLASRLRFNKPSINLHASCFILTSLIRSSSALHNFNVQLQVFNLTLPTVMNSRGCAGEQWGPSGSPGKHRIEPFVSSRHALRCHIIAGAEISAVLRCQLWTHCCPDTPCRDLSAAARLIGRRRRAAVLPHRLTNRCVASRAR